MIVPFSQILLLAGLLFLCGILCTILHKNLIMILIGLEIMLNAMAVAFVGSGIFLKETEGQVFALFILVVAAAEVSVGLALIVRFYRQTASLDPAYFEDVKR